MIKRMRWQVVLLVGLALLIGCSPIMAAEDRISLQVRDADIEDVLVMLTEQSDINLVPDENLSGKVTINLNKVKIEEAIQLLTKTYDYRFKKTMNDTYIVSKSPRENLSVSVLEGKVTMVAKNANMGQVLRSISHLSSVNMVLFGPIRAKIDLELDSIPVEKAIKLVLSGSRYTYKKKQDVYLIGEKNVNSPSSGLLTSSKLIPLEYLQAEKIPKMLPSSIPASTIKVIKEQNAIMVTGTQDDVEKVRNYINKIDQEVPQVVVEALIIDITHKKNKSPTLNVESQAGNHTRSTIFDSSLGKLTYNSITRLPEEFYVKLQAMIEEGQASVKANPNITTLNGQEANIEVSDVQYYEVTQEDSEGAKETRYKSLDIGVSLKVTPWVSNSGAITLELNPEVSSPSTQAGAGSNSGPPDVVRRQVSTTVRVKDGQTIVIGGLMRDNGSQTVSKVPLLGDIPMIGSLFRSREVSVDKTELMLYITPHILKKEGADKARMRELLRKADKISGQDDKQEKKK